MFENCLKILENFLKILLIIFEYFWKFTKFFKIFCIFLKNFWKSVPPPKKPGLCPCNVPYPRIPFWRAPHLWTPKRIWTGSTKKMKISLHKFIIIFQMKEKRTGQRKQEHVLIHLVHPWNVYDWSKQFRLAARQHSLLLIEMIIS